MKKTQDKILRDYYNMLFPQKLNNREFVRVVKMNRDKGFIKQEFLKSFDEFLQFVQKNKYYFDLYVGLSTVKQINGICKGTESYQNKRHVLFVDFDKKEYKDLCNARDFSALIKNKTDIYTHMCINSGHGVHFYIATQSTNDIKEISSINKTLIQLVGADEAAGLSTQIARIPCTYNHKMSDGTYDYNFYNKDKWEYVKVVYDGLEGSSFYRYDLKH